MVRRLFRDDLTDELEDVIIFGSDVLLSAGLTLL